MVCLEMQVSSRYPSGNKWQIKLWAQGWWKPREATGKVNKRPIRAFVETADLESGKSLTFFEREGWEEGEFDAAPEHFPEPHSVRGRGSIIDLLNRCLGGCFSDPVRFNTWKGRHVASAEGALHRVAGERGSEDSKFQEGWEASGWSERCGGLTGDCFLFTCWLLSEGLCFSALHLKILIRVQVIVIICSQIHHLGGSGFLSPGFSCAALGGAQGPIHLFGARTYL